MENTTEVPQKLKLDLSYDLGIPLLGIQIKECKPGQSIATSTSMFTAVLVTIAKLSK
jgi:hypothetical protein